jgi:hypothetical protein
VAVVIVAGFAAYAVFAPRSPTGLQPPGKRGALVWGDGVFANKGELRPWLSVHGGRYAAWKRRHPAALRLLTAPRHRHAVTRRHVARPSLKKAAAGHKTIAPATARKSGARLATPSPPQVNRTPRNWVLMVLAALGLLIACGAALPTFVLLRVGVSPRGDGRVLAATTGGAILVGVAVATLLN